MQSSILWMRDGIKSNPYLVEGPNLEDWAKVFGSYKVIV